MDFRSLVETGTEGLTRLAALVEQYPSEGVFILVDEHTNSLCLPLLIEKVPRLQSAAVITIPAGEEHKVISTAETVWTELTTLGALRSSLLLCLGGGVITDLGGFVAATFRRGIDYVLVPTTLLGMVDAAIGGKSALNLNGMKNQLGLISKPKAVFLYSGFLKTLPERQLHSGFAEMVKHALLNGTSHFNEILHCNLRNEDTIEQLILKSARIKMEVVESDPLEKGPRKLLNLGHTIGHALEAYSLLHDPEPLLHGEAVAAGLVCEAFISLRMLGLPETDLQSIANLVSWYFPHYRLRPSACNDLIAFMLKDKKIDSPGKINFSLLQSIGNPVFDQYPGEKLIRESLHFYVNIEFGFFS